MAQVSMIKAQVSSRPEPGVLLNLTLESCQLSGPNTERPTRNAEVGNADASIITPCPVCGSGFPMGFDVERSVFDVQRSSDLSSET